MYSHLTASVAAERTEDDMYAAHLRQLARAAGAPTPTVQTAPAERATPTGRTPLVRWVRARSRRRAGHSAARPARA